jgi:DNA polymerase III sliding clamp (beta) subunit (PCNA family)
MLLTRQQLGALAFASTDQSRQALQCLRIDPDGTIWATDGHTLARVKHQGPGEEEFPVIPAIPADAVSPPATVLLPATLAKAVLTALKKVKAGRLPILGHALLRQHGDTLYLAVTDLETPQVWQIKLPDATFPNCEQVLPKDGGKAEAGSFGINGYYLARVGAYRAQFSTYGNDIRVTSQGPTNPVLFEWLDTNGGHEVLCLVMPMRLGG